VKTSKFPRRVFRVAYETACRGLPEYAHKFSPKKFTQLLACLMLKEFSHGTLSNSSSSRNSSRNLLWKEGLRESILPRARRCHIQRRRARRSRKDQTASAANSGPLSLRIRCGGAPRCATGEDFSDLLGRHAPSRLKRQAFSRELVDKTQAFQAPTVAGTCEYNLLC
jgi:hypothetical protein